MKHILLLSLSLVFAACGPKGPTSSASNPCGNPCANPCGGNPCAGASEVDVSDWKNWVKVNENRFLSKGHGKPYVDIYVESAHEAAFRAAKGPYPIGFKVAKAQYKTADATELAAVTVMAKRESGYDPDNGDWWYATLSQSGGVMAQGKVEMCITCHDSASDRDYVFGLPAL